MIIKAKYVEPLTLTVEEAQLLGALLADGVHWIPVKWVTREEYIRLMNKPALPPLISLPEQNTH
jgi:hypothetical protein